MKKNTIKHLCFTTMFLFLVVSIISCNLDSKDNTSESQKKEIPIKITKNSSISSSDSIEVKVNKKQTKIYIQFVPTDHNKSYYTEGRVFVVKVNGKQYEFDGKDCSTGSFYDEIIGSYFQIDLPANITKINVEYISVAQKIFNITLDNDLSNVVTFYNGPVKTSTPDNSKTITLFWNDTINWLAKDQNSEIRACLYYKRPYPENNPTTTIDYTIEDGFYIGPNASLYEICFHLHLNNNYTKFKGIGPHELHAKMSSK